ncbi:hypothetical protein PXH69_24785 [Rhodococcus qingshengii]|uniref:Uncharacterized protein n=1 Tax=Rhodococcus qingshengii TaxID=334542 RepID=A0AAW6LUV0_RHOSG|nr:hypothetical protein [Rhodococcus qingshengii]MDE8648188.1 hypothetical protein [Rhodococcus qingshengii]
MSSRTFWHRLSPFPPLPEREVSLALQAWATAYREAERQVIERYLKYPILEREITCVKCGGEIRAYGLSSLHLTETVGNRSGWREVEMKLNRCLRHWPPLVFESLYRREFELVKQRCIHCGSGRRESRPLDTAGSDFMPATQLPEKHEDGLSELLYAARSM